MADSKTKENGGDDWGCFRGLRRREEEEDKKRMMLMVLMMLILILNDWRSEEHEVFVKISRHRV
jgi:hypothetical protein